MVDTLIESCSFCGKHKDSVQKLIVSDSVSICNDCVSLCQDLLQDKNRDVTIEKSVLDPREIKTFVDQWVIGQHRAKMVLAVAVVNHYKRINRSATDPEITKANILMIGPTGSGKTLLARSIARYLDVPFVVADATSLTEAGYVGDDVESLISRLYAKSGGNIEKTQRGIIFIDEIDKISRRSESPSLTRDVSGEGVQQALLKLVEGTQCRIQPQNNRKHPSQDMLEIDTSNILFLAGGAFVGLEQIVSQRTCGTNIGFATPLARDKSSDLSMSTPDDLVRFGMIPEFTGRFPVMVTLDLLTRDDLMSVLTNVKDNLYHQYQWLLKQDNIDLEMPTNSLLAVVDRAISSGTGARALQAEMERVLLPHMYAAHDYRQRGIDRLVIDLDLINNPSPV